MPPTPHPDSVEGARCDSRTFSAYEGLAADFQRFMDNIPTHLDPSN